jgi:cobaltochelatase CobT
VETIDMRSAQALVRRRERVGELCGAVARALVGDSHLQFRGQRLHRGRRPLPLFAPHLHPSFDRDDFRSFRGAIDGIASRLTH